MAKSWRNNFSSGVLDPKLAARSDIEQYRTGLRTGTNVLLLPHGGVRRRPGTRWIATLTEEGRTARFKFNLEQQYLFHFINESLWIYEDEDALTRVETPWPTAVLPEIDVRAQTADTMVICHPDYPPHRLLRAALANNPIRVSNSGAYWCTTAGTVVVEHPDHKLLDGDVVSLSNIAALPTTIGGVSVQQLGEPYPIDTIEGTLGTNPVATTSADKTVRIIIASHKFAVGERVVFDNLEATGGVPADQLNKARTITVIGGSGASAWVEFEVESDATSTVAAGGGAAGTWKSPDLYRIVTAETATSSATGGGADGRAWILYSLAPDEDRKVALKNLPQFDFEDKLSPPPAREIQRLKFDAFLTGDTFALIVGGARLSDATSSARGYGGQVSSFANYRTQLITWDAIKANNASLIQEAINAATSDGIDIVSVEYDVDNSDVPSNHHEYVITYTDAVDWDLIQPHDVVTAGGGIVIPTLDVSGGSTEEDVISANRGWPAGAIFFQRRLWFYGIASRPSTLLASKVEDFYNFDTGSALDGDAIDATGEFDPIRFLIAERGLLMLTSASEVEVSGGSANAAIAPGNITFQVSARFGSTGVPPISVAGRPMYVDRIGRNVRQLGASLESPTGQVESKELSILSQHLIDNPQRLELWRTADGDYMFAVNEDGTAAVLNINVDQGVAGWTKVTTTGLYLDAVEVDDTLYATVSRTINGTPRIFLEAFDYDSFTDCGARETSGASSSWSGLSHLNGETVQVRGDSMTMENAVVSAGAVSTLSGDAAVSVTSFEGGLAIPTPTVEPMPPALSKYSAVVKASVDVFESREVHINGFAMRPYLSHQPVTTAASPVVTGFREIQLRGYGDRQTVAITAPNPQPMLLRAIEMEVA